MREAGEARGGDGNCTDNWGLLYKDNTRLVGQPNTITILKCFSFDVCQIGGCFNPLFNLSLTVSKVSRFLLLRPCFSLFQIPSLIQLLFESSVTRKPDSLVKAKLLIKISKITVIDGCH